MPNRLPRRLLLLQPLLLLFLLAALVLAEFERESLVVVLCLLLDVAIGTSAVVDRRNVVLIGVGIDILGNERPRRDERRGAEG